MFEVLYGNEVRNKNDVLNTERVRNIRNTAKSAYNCAGYALETFNWFLPDTDYSGSTDDDVNTARCVKSMLKVFKGNLRVITDVSELLDDEYAIAFRVGNGDFHFMKRAKNGIWYNKLGYLSDIRKLPANEVLNSDWNLYNGPVVLLAKKRIK